MSKMPAAPENRDLEDPQAPDTGNEGEQDKPLAHPLLAEIIITLAGVFLRNGVVRLLENRNLVQTDADKELLKTSPSRRIATLGVRKLATRSVPGALAVGAGIVAKSLLSQRKARKALRARKADALLPAPDTKTPSD